jgi:hypothetical protein
MDINEIDRLFAGFGIDNAYYDHGGRKISEEQWRELLNDYDYRMLAKTQVFDKANCIGTSFFVSTAWTGRNYGTGNSVLIFETLVTDNRGREVEGLRSGSTAKAWQAHQQMVDAQKAKCADPAQLTVQLSSHTPA